MCMALCVGRMEVRVGVGVGGRSLLIGADLLHSFPTVAAANHPKVRSLEATQIYYSSQSQESEAGLTGQQPRGRWGWLLPEAPG